jgi:hypothetical protein
MSANHYKRHRVIFAGFGRFKNFKLYCPLKGAIPEICRGKAKN